LNWVRNFYCIPWGYWSEDNALGVRRKPRKIEPDSRRVVVVEFKGESPPPEICRQYEISENL